MTEWYDSQKRPNSDFRKLLRERLDKANPMYNILAMYDVELYSDSAY